MAELADALDLGFCALNMVCGYGGIGRHVGLRNQWETMQVRVLLSAPDKGLRGFEFLKREVEISHFFMREINVHFEIILRVNFLLLCRKEDEL